MLSTIRPSSLVVSSIRSSAAIQLRRAQKSVLLSRVHILVLAATTTPLQLDILPPPTTQSPPYLSLDKSLQILIHQSLLSTEKEQVENYFEGALTSALDSNGVLPEDSTVTVTEINEGVISYGIDIPEAEKESVDKISAEINSVLESPAVLETMSSEVVSQFSQTPLVEELSALDVPSSYLSADVAQLGDKVMVSGKLNSNLDTSNLIWTQKEAIETYFENAIKETLESIGVIPTGTTVTVNDVGSGGSVPFEITVTANNSVNAEKIVEEIKTIMSEPPTLDAITAHVVNTFAETGLVQELSSLEVTGATPGKTSVSTTSASTGQILAACAKQMRSALTWTFFSMA